jgi:predicted SAM-dependent methyltransferase
MKIRHSDLVSFVPVLNRRGAKTLLHVGCGTAPTSRLPECFKLPEWKEIRLDIDPETRPDIVASITNLEMIATNTVDAVWSSHNLEHLEGYQVPIALNEIRRVIKPGGFALFTMPDLEAIAQLVASNKGEEVLYTSPAGPITPLDMLYGHQKSIRNGNDHMAHRTGFTAKRLSRLLAEAGFDEVRVMCGKNYDLWAIAIP